MRRFVVGVLALASAGCTGSGHAVATSGTTTPTVLSETATSQVVVSTSTIVTIVKTPPATATTEGVVATLKAAGLPIGEVQTFGAADDPNQRLGQPGQYIAKATFRDSRLKAASLDIDAGGTIEIFSNPKDLNDRVSGLRNARVGSRPTAFTYTHDVVLLRVSAKLTPEQASGYGAAIAAAFGGGSS